MIKPFIERYIGLETLAGILLMVSMGVALVMSNVPAWANLYDYIQHMYIGFTFGPLAFKQSFLHWVNDGLMALFFFLISLEIKREALQGELSEINKALLPILGAIGGMVMPIAIYVYFNIGNPDTLQGWAIPGATDIAFALGILALLGNRVPLALKIFLTTLAVVDDLGAIVILALFYSGDLQIPYVLGTLGIIGVMIGGAWMRRFPAGVFVFLGFILWVFLLNSGIHATLAGVITALFIPTQCKISEIKNPLEHFEHQLHGWVTFLIIPLFAFMNAGVALPTTAMDITPLMWGIFLGLIVGKQVGVFGICYTAIKLGIAQLPNGVNMRQLYGASVLCGVGFTMSLFIGSIPFSSTPYMDAIRISVIGASVVSAIWGILVLLSVKTK